MKIIILSFLISITSINVFSKEIAKADSLNNIIENSVDTVKFDALIGLAIYFYDIQDYFNAINNINIAIKTLPNDTKRLSRANNFLGVIYNYIGDYPKALEFHLKSIKYREQLDDEKFIAEGYNSISITYTALNNFEKSMYYLKKALIINEKFNDTLSQSMLMNNIGTNYSKQKKYKKALSYFLKSKKLIEYTQLDKSILYLNIGDLYVKLKNYSQAIKYYNTVEEYSNIQANKYNLSIVYSRIANLAFLENNIPKSSKYYMKSIAIAEKIKANDILKDNYKGLTTVYYVNYNKDSILKYNDLFFSINDSIFNSQVSEKIAEFEIKYDFENKKNHIQDLTIENKEMNKKLTIFIILFAISIIVLLIIFFYRFKANTDKFAIKQSVKLLEYEDVIINSPTQNDTRFKVNDTNVKLDENFKTMLEVSILKTMQKDKIYLKNDFTLDKLSKLLNTNRHYISQVINERFEQNFNSFINEFRVKESMRLMAKPEYSKYTIEVIFKKVGFNSSSVFNAAFKKVTSVTPSAYFRSVLK